MWKKEKKGTKISGWIEEINKQKFAFVRFLLGIPWTKAYNILCKEGHSGKWNGLNHLPGEKKSVFDSILQNYLLTTHRQPVIYPGKLRRCLFSLAGFNKLVTSACEGSSTSRKKATVIIKDERKREWEEDKAELHLLFTTAVWFNRVCWFSVNFLTALTSLSNDDCLTNHPFYFLILYWRP